MDDKIPLLMRSGKLAVRGGDLFFSQYSTVAYRLLGRTGDKVHDLIANTGYYSLLLCS